MRIELSAAVQLDALADVDGVDQAVGRDARHAIGEHGDGIPLAVKGVQGLVDVLHDGAHQVGRRGHGVQALRLANHRQVGRSALGRRGKGGQRQGGEQQRDEVPTGQVQHESLLVKGQNERGRMEREQNGREKCK